VRNVLTSMIVAGVLAVAGPAWACPPGCGCGCQDPGVQPSVGVDVYGRRITRDQYGRPRVYIREEYSPPPFQYQAPPVGRPRSYPQVPLQRPQVAEAPN
jgi:hypothetical protein